MVREPGPPTLIHLRDDARAAQRAAYASGMILHVLVWLLRPEDRFTIRQGIAHPIVDRVRVLTRERKNFPPCGSSPSGYRSLRRAQSGCGKHAGGELGEMCG
jgi:hypothetical protein